MQVPKAWGTPGEQAEEMAWSVSDAKTGLTVFSCAANSHSLCLITICRSGVFGGASCDKIKP